MHSLLQGLENQAMSELQSDSIEFDNTSKSGTRFIPEFTKAGNPSSQIRIQGGLGDLLPGRPRSASSKVGYLVSFNKSPNTLF